MLGGALIPRLAMPGRYNDTRLPLALHCALYFLAAAVASRSPAWRPSWRSGNAAADDAGREFCLTGRAGAYYDVTEVLTDSAARTRAMI
ncbi:MAG: hypothetical protein ACLVL7_09825 [Anaerotruncus massiliensis (ex Togo et al. 2019)]